MPALWHHLLQDGDVSGVPGLGDDVELAVDLAHHGVVDVLKGLQAQLILDHHRGNHPVAF